MSVGVVSAAAPQGVFPWHLAAAFSRDDSYNILVNNYIDGECQKRALVETARAGFRLSETLTASQLRELTAFWGSHLTAFPFYFYDVAETANFGYDASGVSTQGRYIVRFDGPFQTQFGLGRIGRANVRLVEVA